MRTLMALAMAMLFLICNGCGDTREKLAEENFSIINEMTTLLEGVKDEASATSAKPKLKSLLERMSSVNERAAKLPAPSEAETKAMIDKHGTRMDEMVRKFQSQMMRISFDPKLRPMFDDLDQVMAKAMR
jgi:hypothetical protein